MLRNRNRLEAQLAMVWPEVLSLLDLDSSVLLSVVKEYGTPHEIDLHSDEAAVLMKKVGGHFLSKEKLAALLSSAHNSIGVAINKEEISCLKQLVEDILRSKAGYRKAKTHLTKLSQANKSIANMTSVAGPITSSALIVGLGEPQKYSSADAWVKAAGLNLKVNQSGKKSGQLTITKRGPGYVRKFLYLLVLRLIQTNPLIKIWYESKVHRDGGKIKKKAIVALMRKVLKGLYHVSRGAKWDESKLFDEKRLQKSKPYKQVA